MYTEKCQVHNEKASRDFSFSEYVIPALSLVIQAVAAVFGWTLDFTSLIGSPIAVVDSVFALLVILGIVVNPTTAGISDSQQAMTYQEPWQDN